uniref:Ig-like domain-containing protein n=1 Tax=Leptobrachium leishanense TaxID=445787 RepID=A0A8C5M3K1_9ANUR
LQMRPDEFGNKMRSWLCALLCVLLPGDNVTQTELVLHVTDGAEATFNCIYETSYSSPDLFWYLQVSGMSPRSIIHRAAHRNDEKEPETRYESKLDKDKKSIYLKILDVRVSDSGVYYCALRGRAASFGGACWEEEACCERTGASSELGPIYIHV